MIKSVVNITDNLCTKQENLGLKFAVSNQVRFEIKSGLKSRVGYNGACALYSSNTVQYRPSENKIVFGLKVSSGDGLGLILSLK